MNDIKERLGIEKYNFLQSLEYYIENELIFFGSIKRIDFFKENSDIDIAIISDNVPSTIKKLQTFLNLDDNKMRTMLQKIPNKNTIIQGYKTNYSNENIGLDIEVIIYDSKYKNDVLTHINNINNFPLYITIPLIILKCFFYKLNIISSDFFKYLKTSLMHKYLKQDLDNNLIVFKLKK
jgi:predicted nucleotidyltransferase